MVQNLQNFIKLEVKTLKLYKNGLKTAKNVKI